MIDEREKKKRYKIDRKKKKSSRKRIRKSPVIGTPK